MIDVLREAHLHLKMVLSEKRDALNTQSALCLCGHVDGVSGPLLDVPVTHLCPLLPRRQVLLCARRELVFSQIACGVPPADAELLPHGHVVVATRRVVCPPAEDLAPPRRGPLDVLVVRIRLDARLDAPLHKDVRGAAEDLEADDAHGAAGAVVEAVAVRGEDGGDVGAGGGGRAGRRVGVQAFDVRVGDGDAQGGLGWAGAGGGCGLGGFEEEADGLGAAFF